MGVFSSGSYWGVFGSIREYLKILILWGCVGVGGGYGAPRPGCALYGEKIPRPGDVFPGKYPFRPPARKFPPRPAVLLSSTQPTPPGQNKKPRKNPRGSAFGLLTRCPTLPALSPVQISVAIFPEWWLVAQGLHCARKSEQ